MCAAQGPSMVKPEAGVSDVNLSGETLQLMRACYNGDAEGMSKWLDKGADASSFDVNRGSPLHFAAAHGIRALCERLIDDGADIDAQDLAGYTPLHMATGYERVDTVILLLKLGADANKATYDAASTLAVEIAERALASTPSKTLLGFDPNKDLRQLRQRLVDILDGATESEDVDDVMQRDDTTVVIRQREATEEAQPDVATDVKVTIRVRGEVQE